MTSIDLTSAAACEILSLNKKEVTKRLQVAVRDSQGGKRASWAAVDRPSWWNENFSLTLADGDQVSALKFASQSKSYWPVESARVTLLLFEFRQTLLTEDQRAEDVSTRTDESPKLVKVREQNVDEGVHEHDEPEDVDDSDHSPLIVRPTRARKGTTRRKVATRSNARQAHKPAASVRRQSRQSLQSSPTETYDDTLHISDDDDDISVQPLRTRPQRKLRAVPKQPRKIHLTSTPDSSEGESGHDPMQLSDVDQTSSQEPDVVVTSPIRKVHPSTRGKIGNQRRNLRSRAKGASNLKPDSFNSDNSDERVDDLDEDTQHADHEQNTRSRVKAANVVHEQPKKPVTRRKIATRSSLDRSLDRQDVPSTQSPVATSPNSGEDGDSDETNTNTSSDIDTVEEQRRARIAAIDAEQTEFTKLFKARSHEFQRECNRKLKAMEQLYQSESTQLTGAHHIFKMKHFPPRVLDMPLGEYVKKYSADNYERVLKEASRRARRVLEVTTFAQPSGAYENPAPTPYAQARRDAVTNTTRKVTRAAREQRDGFAVPTTMRRTRPQRSAAKAAATRTQAILQGSVVRRGTAQSVRRSTRRPNVPLPSAMKTPAPARATARGLPVAVREAFLESIRKEPNPRAVFQQLAENPAALVAELEAYL